MARLSLPGRIRSEMAGVILKLLSAHGKLDHLFATSTYANVHVIPRKLLEGRITVGMPLCPPFENSETQYFQLMIIAILIYQALRKHLMELANVPMLSEKGVTLPRILHPAAFVAQLTVYEEGRRVSLFFLVTVINQVDVVVWVLVERIDILILLVSSLG